MSAVACVGERGQAWRASCVPCPSTAIFSVVKANRASTLSERSANEKQTLPRETFEHAKRCVLKKLKRVGENVLIFIWLAP